MCVGVESVERIIRRHTDGMPMVLVPAGEFLMGITDEEYEFIHQEFSIPPWNERPQRRVYLDAYYVGQFAVSNQQFCAFLNATANGTPTELVEQIRAFHPASRIQMKNGRACPEPSYSRHPAVVPWTFARRYAEWTGCSLPTEAQWEKAARGTDGRRFPWGNQIPTPDGFLCNLGPDLKEVDCCPQGRSPYGCFNMSGNVWEWCLDFYRGDFYAGMPDRNPVNPEETDHPAYRGGGFPFRSPYFHRTTVRAIESAEHCNNPVGFRCVRARPTF